MNEEEFKKSIEELGLSISEEQLESFKKYADYLLEYNKKTNLTAIREVKDVYLKHFYDSLLLLKYKDLSCKTVLDIGSGAGFPGVVLKIMEPSIDLVLLDSNNKKTFFLENLKTKLGLSYTVINKRAEEYVKERREFFDIVVARAVKELSILSELCIPFVKIGGHFISYKGNMDETLENSLFAIDVLGGEVEDVIKSTLPIEESIRTFVVISKKCQTDKQYPRVFDKIIKKPLQK